MPVRAHVQAQARAQTREFLHVVLPQRAKTDRSSKSKHMYYLVAFPTLITKAFPNASEIQ
eukprot:6360033-Amphidinium_carterae.1